MLGAQVIIYITMLLFAFKVYTSGLYPIGSIEKVWNNLNRMAEPDAVPVSGMPQQPPLAPCATRLQNLWAHQVIVAHFSKDTGASSRDMPDPFLACSPTTWWLTRWPSSQQCMCVPLSLRQQGRLLPHHHVPGRTRVWHPEHHCVLWQRVVRTSTVTFLLLGWSG